MKNTIKMRAIFTTVLVLMSATLMAVTYPKQAHRITYSMLHPAEFSQRHGAMIGETEDATPISLYTTSEDVSGSSNKAPSRPMRSHTEGGDEPPESPGDGDTWTDDSGVTWTYSGGDWERESGLHAGDPMPVGSPVLPFLLFAMMACGVIYYRRNIVKNV